MAKQSKAAKPTATLDGMNYLVTLGSTGLNTIAGTVNERDMAQLDGVRGVKVYTEMVRNSPIIGAFNLVLIYLSQQCDWEIEAASDSPEDIEAQQFLTENLDDMDHTWRDFISEVLSMANYGWSAHEICFKVRGGFSDDPLYNSRFDDNRIGLAGLPIRSQDTLLSFNFYKDPRTGRTDTDRITGMRQYLDNGAVTTIARSKLALFRTMSYKNNPLGRSLLRHAYSSYARSERLKDYEALSIQRDTVGMPMLRVPSKMLQATASPNEKATVAKLQAAMQDLWNANIKFITLPSDTDDKGNRAIDMDLVGSPGDKQHPIRETIREYDMDIARALLFDILYLGSGSVGSFALASSKTTLLATLIGGLLDGVCETFNRDVVPLLMRLNGFGVKSTPRLKRGDIEIPDLNELANYISSMAAVGALTLPDPAIEAKVRKLGNLPPLKANMNEDVGTGAGEGDDDLPEGDNDDLSANNPAA